MLRTTDDLRAWLRRDLLSYGLEPRLRPALLRELLRAPQLRWQIRLRITELCINRRSGIVGRALGAFMRWRLLERSVRLGFTIPPNVCGPGLKLPHWGTIVLSAEARLGADCVIHPGVSVGVNHGRAPRIGDRVYLGPGAKVMGGIVIADGVTVGANSVVTRDVPEGARVVGAPARPIRDIDEAAADHAVMFGRDE